MIAYCDLNPWLEIDLKEFTFKRDGVWIKNRPFSEPIVNNSFSYLHEFESVFSYDNIMNIDFTTSHISNVLTSISKDSDYINENKYTIVDDIFNYINHISATVECNANVNKDDKFTVLYDPNYIFNETSEINSIVIYISGNVDDENVKILFLINFKNHVVSYSCNLNIVIKMVTKEDINVILITEQLKLESLRNTYKSAATAYKKKRIKYNVRSKLTFNKEETNVINFKQKKEAGN